MATRIDRGVSQTDLRNDLSLLKDYLLRRAGRKLGDTNYQALLRNNALSDLTDSGQALTNVLEYLTDVSDSAEVSLYGKYTITDWEVTSEFVDNELTKEFLSPLKNASIVGGLLGSTVSVSPRIRIEDRISLSDSFYGRGTWPGLGSGCSAFFYRVPSGRVLEVGFVNFNFNTSTGAMSFVVFYEPDGTTVTTPSAICGDESSVVLEFSSYVNTSTNESINLLGSEISIKVTKEGDVVEVFDENSRELITNTYNILTQAVFNTIKFELVRPYSTKNQPKWFAESPAESSNLVAGSADDIDPLTTFAVLNYTNGEFRPYTEREYWYSKEYVETRWSLTERTLLGVELNVDGSAGIYQDSNMRFFEPPTVVKEYKDNWGIRWDGYLVITNPSSQKFAFNVKTNTGIRIDVANGEDEFGPTWSTVFNSLDENASVRVNPTSDQFYSKQSFVLDDTSLRFIHYTNDDLVDYIVYLPISIRLFHGAFDKAYPETIIDPEPNLFIKLMSSTNVDPKTYYGGDTIVSIELDGSDYLVIPDGAEGSIDLLSVLNDPLSSSSYSLITQGQEVVRLVQNGVDGNNQPVFVEETVSLQTAITPVPLTLIVDGGLIKITGFTGDVGVYTLRVTPSILDYSDEALWKSRFISPPKTYKSYEELVNGDFEPSIYKYEYNDRPQWWKVSDGHKYLRSSDITSVNTPLDGFILNSFRPTLSSLAPDHGLYGDGAGNYSNRPNIILGESKYLNDGLDSQNYIGIRLVKNFLGEGGKIRITGLPVNNSTFSDSTLLGANDLGGSPNHLTASANRIGSRVFRPYLYNAGVEGVPDRFYLVANPTTVTASDTPETLGLPPFSNVAAWASPITITAVEKADNDLFTTGVLPFVAPLTLNAEKVVFNNGGTNYDLVAFTTTLQSILTGGLDVSNFSGKYIRFYNEVDSAFQFSRVDTGESISFSDVLKLTYIGPRVEFNASTAVNYTTNLITIVNHGFQINTTSQVYYRNNGNASISGLTNNGVYYVYPPTTDTLYVVDASNYPTSGSIVDLVTGATGTHVLSSPPNSAASEVPKPPAERVTPFGYDVPDYSSGLCYPPYAIGDSLLERIAVTDEDLSTAPEGNYDVFWGDHTQPSTLGGNYLELTEKLEFSHSVLEPQSNVIVNGSSKVISTDNYTHRLRIDFPIDPVIIAETPDVAEHLGNQEKVKDTYYLFVNGRTSPTSPTSQLLPGL